MIWPNNLRFFAGVILLLPALCAQTIIGTAAYRERIALPPNAVFEVTLEDVSKADAPAGIIGSTKIDKPGQPPIHFSISYDPSHIIANHSYSVRARVAVNGNLMFTSDQSYPVLTGGNGRVVTIMMRRASGAANSGSPAGSSKEVSGMFRYMADAATFTDCSTGTRLPVAMEGDYKALEAAYLRVQRKSGEELMVTIEGQAAPRPIADGGRSVSTFIVSRYIGIWPGETCGAAGITSQLEGTYWKLTRLAEKPVIIAPGTREPHVLLNADQHHVSGFAGCNNMSGTYSLKNTKPASGEIYFSSVASTMMACISGMDTENALFKALGDARSWKIIGQHLELCDASGKQVARFEGKPLNK